MTALEKLERAVGAIRALGAKDGVQAAALAAYDAGDRARAVEILGFEDDVEFPRHSVASQERVDALLYGREPAHRVRIQALADGDTCSEFACARLVVVAYTEPARTERCKAQLIAALSTAGIHGSMAIEPDEG